MYGDAFSVSALVLLVVAQTLSNGYLLFGSQFLAMLKEDQVQLNLGQKIVLIKILQQLRPSKSQRRKLDASVFVENNLKCCWMLNRYH
ncbi:hypothetical protein DPMN_056555 [Dreissena polymorpha]|uniref:Uncharacterized protein n=1 Tax=Dreissena polymorpha TaxID=45954 RepID=A0A9D4CUR1_DREPO|nr:hypothetical protein DPMN_056555 [Dreissena polymorpha]